MHLILPTWLRVGLPKYNRVNNVLENDMDSDDEGRLFKVIAPGTATSRWKFNRPDQIQQASIPTKVRWIMGDQPSMAYCRLIAHGGFGEVHEVRPTFHSLNICKLYDIPGSFVMATLSWQLAEISILRERLFGR